MVIGNSEGVGISKARIFKEKYEAKLEFLEGLGVQTKKLPVGGVWIFSGTAQFIELHGTSCRKKIPPVFAKH